MSFRQFLKSKTFFLNILFAILVTVIIIVLAMYGIRIYTHHGKSLAVPDFSGMNLDELSEKAMENDLLFELIDSVYVDNIAPGTVVDQSPEAGFRVKEGRTIFITISATTPEQVAMPKLTDISLRQAENIMQTNGLVVGQINYIPSEYPDLVLSQKINDEEIEVGTMVNKGIAIDLTVGQTMSGEFTVVPDLVGASLEQAKEEINALLLNTGALIYDESVVSPEDTLNAIIWRQRPEPSSTEDTEQGTSVDLWLTIDVDKLLTGEDDGM